MYTLRESTVNSRTATTHGVCGKASKPSPTTGQHNLLPPPDALNNFYALFEAQNDTVVRRITPPPDKKGLCFSTDNVRKTLRRVNPWKAMGPDNIPGKVLIGCADLLVDVFIFHTSMSSTIIPQCLKTTTIIPVPAESIAVDLTQPSHQLFTLLLSGRTYRSIHVLTLHCPP